MTLQHQTYITTAGATAWMNQTALKQPTEITHAAVFDGGADLLNTEEQVRALTSLDIAHRKSHGAVNYYGKDPERSGLLLVEYIIPPNHAGFTVRYVGWYLADGTLLAVTNYPPSFKSAAPLEYALPIKSFINLSATSSTKYLVDPNSVLASRDYVNRRSWPVSLTGNKTVYSGTTAQFVMENFSDFSRYEVQSDAGTATLSGKTVSLVIPGNTAGEKTLTITRDNIAHVFTLQVNAPTIQAPIIASPLNGATNVVTLPSVTLAPFVVLPTGFDTHASTQYQIASDAAFTTIVFDSGIDTTHKTSIVVPDNKELPTSTQIYVRARYKGATLTSAWSAVVSFTTSDKAAFSFSSIFQMIKHTGTGALKQLNTGIDAISGKSLVISKALTLANHNHAVFDSVRGPRKRLVTPSGQKEDLTDGVMQFRSNGIELGTNTEVNKSGEEYLLLQFLAAKGFIDIVTYSGNGTQQDIAHNLGSVPGMIWIKNRTSSGSWVVTHKDMGVNDYVYVDHSIAATQATGNNLWDSQRATAASFHVKDNAQVNASGNDYLAIVFANNPTKGIVCGK